MNAPMTLNWPYQHYRIRQKDVVDKIIDALSHREFVALSAPTGFGKTITILYAVLKFILDQDCTDLKVLYLVRTKNEVEPVLRELYALKRSSPESDFKYSFIIGKRNLCYHILMTYYEEADFDYEDFAQICKHLRRQGQCPLLRVEYKTFESTKDAVDYILKFGACPWYVINAWGRDVDVLIGTYPFLFNPYIRRSFIEEYEVNFPSMILVLDEAHNLESILQNANRSISLRTVLRALEDLKKYGDLLDGRKVEVAERYIRALAKFIQLRARDQEKLSRVGLETFNEEILNVVDLDVLEEAALKILQLKMKLEGFKSRCFICSVFRFLLASRIIYDLSRENYELFAVKNRLELKVLVPFAVTSFLNDVYSLILSSGTLPPKEYLVDVFGINRDISYIEVKDVFPESNVKFFIGPEATSKYTERSLTNFLKMAIYILRIRSLIEPEYIVLVAYPSYEFLENVYKLLRELEKRLGVGFNHIVEGKETKLVDVAEEVKSRINVILHCVAGGKFTEGIEFTVNKRSLIRAIAVAGLPFPEPSEYLEARMRRYKEMFGREKAWDYLMLIPTIVKVKQALGRAIRSPEDKAFFFLLDRRVLSQRILKLLEIEKYRMFYLPPSAKRLITEMVVERSSARE